MIGTFRSPCRYRKAGRRSSEGWTGKALLSFGICSLFAWFQPSPAFGTGFFGPLQYLDNGGRNVDLSPEFYWELEVKRLSARFHPPEKLHLIKIEESNGDAAEDQPKLVATAEADAKDFDQAIQQGQIKPPDLEKARQEHQAARDLISRTNDKTTDTLPREFDSEFADYDRGAFAYRRGKEHWDEAAKAWQQLLQRPEAERHYRTVWALFMLGKIAVRSGDPEAVIWFEKTRQTAKLGFADSLGMAADSYGWEGRSEWKQNRPGKAAALFLTQLALGDTSAIVSLKALIPDRSPVDGMLNYGMEVDDLNKLTPEQKNAEDRKTQIALRSAAKDPLLRSLVTAHILATESTEQNPTTQSLPQTGPQTRCGRWLQAINESNLTQVDDAEYLGWAAYNNANYAEAEHWLQLAKTESPAAAWLQAKLQRRKGQMNDAARSMAKAWESIHNLERYTDWSGSTEERYLTGPDGYSWSFDESASGDLGGLRLERADFVQTLETFWRGGLWDDAAYVAEHVLSAAELRDFVDRQPDAAGSKDFSWPSASGGLGDLKYLLGRRLVREDQYDQAARYLKPPYDKVLARYVRALNDGANERLAKEERARAWFTAAWLARFDGMELMGTEAAPDGFDSGGAFEDVDLAKQRASGVWTLSVYVDGNEKTATLPLVLKPSKQEIERLEQFRTRPDIRFHYRMIAGALAMRAAALLPNNTA
ncbi:MAG: hypothetical protein JOZ60_07480, partial [Verrucomicrobia bacterium]|nr:hypothetical protein [Verrucomicrobiota bacterium]